MESDRTSKLRRAARMAAWGLLGLVLALYLGLPAAMAAVAVWPAASEVGAPPDGFEDVTLRTDDGIELAAWYSAPDNGRAIIVAHGAGGSRDGMRRQALMFAENGYGVLCLDLRGHGGSGGRTNRLGWEGTADIVAAVEFLEEQRDVERIGALGSSMGGEVLLGASATCPRIEAIVADGATRRSTPELLALPSERPLVRNFTARVMYSAVRLFTWSSPPAPLLGEMEEAESTSFLLIAAAEEDLEVAFADVFHETLGDRATVWEVQGVTHTAALSRYPEEYEDRVIGFLDDRLSDAR